MSVLVIVGSRGLPARYGGFEKLASVLEAKLRSGSVDVEVRGTGRAQHQDVTRLHNDRLETLTGTFR